MIPQRERGGKWLEPRGKREKRLLIKRERQARARDARRIIDDSGISTGH